MLKSYSGSIAVRRSSTGARGRMPSSSSGPPWYHKDEPFLPVSCLVFLFSLFLFVPPRVEGHSVIPGVRSGRAVNMTTALIPTTLKPIALFSSRAQSNINTSFDACVGTPNTGTLSDGSDLFRYSFDGKKGDAIDCYHTYCCDDPFGTMLLSVSDNASTKQRADFSKIKQDYPVHEQSDCNFDTVPRGDSVPTSVCQGLPNPDGCIIIECFEDCVGSPNAQSLARNAFSTSCEGKWNQLCEKWSFSYDAFCGKPCTHSIQNNHNVLRITEHALGNGISVATVAGLLYQWARACRHDS